MPPSKSGIADYSAALVEPLGRLLNLEIFTDSISPDVQAQFDCAIYQIGNNGYHEFAYKQALEWAGVVVMHESNLHHLVADMTIKAGDWDAYLAEAEFDGGPAAAEYAKRVRALEVGPDYEGVTMLRRLLSRSRAVIAHSHFVESDVRNAGFVGPVGVIPHGAWIPDADGMSYRYRLGVLPSTTLIGVFGFLKPYKRIAESLRAFKRLLRVQPDARMVLVGEPHPEFPLYTLIQAMGLESSARILGFIPIEDFVGYIAACDVILNLRYPTVGESSGTLLRSLGLGKAVLVSDVGSFKEYPDDICLKVPVDRREEDTLYEFLSLLASRSDVRLALGRRAKNWVQRECSWERVAEHYADFVTSVLDGREWKKRDTEHSEEIVEETRPPVQVEAGYISSWARNQSARAYVETHITRLQKTLEMVPPGTADQRILEMGSYMQITPALKTRLGYGEVRGCYYGPAGQTDRKRVASENGEKFVCDIDLFDAEKDRFPYDDNYFDTVLCCELIEHLPSDPMFMMSEINRVLKTGGYVLVTTPNIGSLRAISAILQGYHPGFFPAYIRPLGPDAEVEARHAREYTPKEIGNLLRNSGFEVLRLETGEFLDEPHPEHGWARHMLEQYKLDTEMRGDGIYALAAKRGPVRERYPAWLYS